MIYENMRPWALYSGQQKISLPKTSDSRDIPGYGNAVYLLTPNRDVSKKLLYSDEITYTSSHYKAFTSDGTYRRKIGPRKIVKNLLMDTNKFYQGSDSDKPGSLKFYSQVNRNSVLQKRQNIIVDLGEWMNIYFSNVILNTARNICEGFAKMMSDLLDLTPQYDNYLLINIDDWVERSKDCVIMNKKLLTNPISIILYTSYYFEDLMSQYGDATLYIVSIKSGQRFIVPINELSKKKFNLFKTRITGFKSISFGVDDETNETGEMSENEIKAENRQSFKQVLFQNLKAGLVGPGADDPDDVMRQAIRDTDEEIRQMMVDSNRDLDTLNVSSELEADKEEKRIADDTEDSDDDEAILAEIDKYLEDNPDLTVDEFFSDEDIEKAMKEIKPGVQKKIAYKFMPDRTDEEIARIERLTKGQSTVIKPLNLKDAKSKTIDKTDLDGFVKTTNENIKENRFMNFDKSYVEKKMETDIDNAVSILSKADYPIFVTGKEVQDSSDPMNLKRTMIYHMEDAKGNKMTIKFDLPVIIDGSYVYINGSKKIIGHQFVLKPLVKTEPDTVQLVSAYNKVFIRRMGQIDSNTNMVLVYMEKHPDEFKLRPGNSVQKNRLAGYDTPLDFDVIAKRYDSFKIGDHLCMTNIDSLLKKYESIKPGFKHPDKLKKLPVAINMKTKELVCIDLDESYTEFLSNLFSEGQISEMMKIKRKPKLLGIKAKMMKKDIPLILFMFFCEGFSSIMKKADIEYHFVTDRKSLKDYNPLKWSVIQLEDGYLVWSKAKPVNNLLMNAIMNLPWETYTIEDLENKETYASLLASEKFYNDRNIEYALDNYKNFLMDPVSQEILTDFGLPTDLMELLVVAAKMLCDNHYKVENDMSNMRIRSNEVLSNLVYIMVTKAYTDYRKTIYKKKPTKISVNPNWVINAFLDGDTTNLVSDYSSLNPVLELEKNRAVTFKGLRGIQKDRAMTLSRRGYNESMLGVCGISTSPKMNWAAV